MIKHYNTQSILFVFIVFTFLACKKCENTSVENAIKGSLSLFIHVKNNNNVDVAMRVYLKTNATKLLERYTSIFIFNGKKDGNSKFIIENLFLGKLFLYTSGFDAIWNGNVFGYAPLSLHSQYTKDNQVNLTIPVNE